MLGNVVITVLSSLSQSLSSSSFTLIIVDVIIIVISDPSTITIVIIHRKRHMVNNIIVRIIVTVYLVLLLLTFSSSLFCTSITNTCLLLHSESCRWRRCSVRTPRTPRSSWRPPLWRQRQGLLLSLCNHLDSKDINCSEWKMSSKMLKISNMSRCLWLRPEHGSVRDWVLSMTQHQSRWSWGTVPYAVCICSWRDSWEGVHDLGPLCIDTHNYY